MWITHHNNVDKWTTFVYFDNFYTFWRVFMHNFINIHKNL